MAGAAAVLQSAPDDYRTLGSIVTFGHYEQDNNVSNGPEPIEWIVLDVQEGKSLLISKYLLDVRRFHKGPETVDWESCTLRTWLNDNFLNTAFSEQEQTAILVTDVDYKTQDRIFLLSDDEAFHQYFTKLADRMCAPTEYAIDNGAYVSSEYSVDGRATGWWWLRSPMWDNGFMASEVIDDGDRRSSPVEYTDLCVRPVFWLNTEAELTGAVSAGVPELPEPVATTSPDDMSREWFQSNPETAPDQPYVTIFIPKDELYPRTDGFFGWHFTPAFEEAHGHSLKITRYMIRWFNQNGKAIPDWVSTTEQEFRDLLGGTVIPAKGRLQIGVGIEYELPDVPRLNGVGIVLTGEDEAGNVYEFRGYGELHGAGE